MMWLSRTPGNQTEIFTTTVANLDTRHKRLPHSCTIKCPSTMPQMHGRIPVNTLSNSVTKPNSSDPQSSSKIFPSTLLEPEARSSCHSARSPCINENIIEISLVYHYMDSNDPLLLHLNPRQRYRMSSNSS